MSHVEKALSDYSQVLGYARICTCTTAETPGPSKRTVSHRTITTAPPKPERFLTPQAPFGLTKWEFCHKLSTRGLPSHNALSRKHGTIELFFVEFQGSGIDAVAQTRGPRAVVKDVA